MIKREIVEYLIYPRIFNSLSILYKGVYCLSFKVYHISKNKTITHAFPFLIPHPDRNEVIDRHYEEPTLHGESNFTFETERFYIMYEEETKKLQSQCIFRLEYQERKVYRTYLSCQLLKRITKDKKSETSLCTRRVSETKYQPLDTQIFIINLPSHSFSHERVYFRNSEFFSSVDMFIGVFKYGSKEFRSKPQLSTLLANHQLAKCNIRMVLEEKVLKKELKQQNCFSFNGQKIDLSNMVGLAYLDLESSINHYCEWFREVIRLRDHFQQHNPYKQITLKIHDLSYLKRGHLMSLGQLGKIYQTQNPEEILLSIMEEKEIIRINIRSLRQHLSVLLFYQSEQHFNQTIKHKYQQLQAKKLLTFIRVQPTLSQTAGQQLRNNAGIEYSKDLPLCPQKLQRIPILLIENYEAPNKTNEKVLTLTVFVHGYQGNSFDFQKAKNYLKKYNRFTNVLIIQSITTQMEKSIEDLGKIVAEQVLKFLQNCGAYYSRINFVGFSLGGLLVRACLPFLNQYNRKLGIFVTFSSPHLGISQLQNNLVKIGIWFLIKVDKVKNLKQLNFQSVKLHDSFLMKLSQSSFISNFKRVVLVSSRDDGFVPLYSTILSRQLCCEKDILMLCDNLISRITRLERVEVMFNTEHGGTLDKLTGRRGHIQFLDNDNFLQLFFKLYGCYF